MTDLTDEEIIALYEKHRGKKINDPKDFCIQRASSFKGVCAVGWFANDRGCMGNEILVGKKIGSCLEMTRIALEANGWKDVDQQQKLALKWVEEVLLVWASPLSETNEHFELESTPSFESPSCVKTDEGWVVKIWVQKPSGMLPQADYYQLEVHFDSVGNIANQKQIRSFYVEY